MLPTQHTRSSEYISPPRTQTQLATSEQTRQNSEDVTEGFSKLGRQFFKVLVMNVSMKYLLLHRDVSTAESNQRAEIATIPKVLHAMCETILNPIDAEMPDEKEKRLILTLNDSVRQGVISFLGRYLKEILHWRYIPTVITYLFELSHKARYLNQAYRSNEAMIKSLLDVIEFVRQQLKQWKDSRNDSTKRKMHNLDSGRKIDKRGESHSDDKLQSHIASRVNTEFELFYEQGKK